jgi:hypothetical protein
MADLGSTHLILGARLTKAAEGLEVPRSVSAGDIAYFEPLDSDEVKHVLCRWWR